MFPPLFSIQIRRCIWILPQSTSYPWSKFIPNFDKVMDLNGKIKTKIYWQTLIDTIEWKIHGGGGGPGGGKLVKISIFKNSSRRSRQTTCISLISCRIKIRADRALYYVSSQPKVINIYVRLIPLGTGCYYYVVVQGGGDSAPEPISKMVLNHLNRSVYDACNFFFEKKYIGGLHG